MRKLVSAVLLGLSVGAIVGASGCASPPAPIRFRVESWVPRGELVAGGFARYELLPGTAKAGQLRIGTRSDGSALDLAVARPGRAVEATRYDLKAGSPLRAAELAGMTLVGDETIVVRAGTFASLHFRKTTRDGVVDVWVSTEIQPLGVLRVIETRGGVATVAVELADYGPVAPAGSTRLATR